MENGKQITAAQILMLMLNNYKRFMAGRIDAKTARDANYILADMVKVAKSAEDEYGAEGYPLFEFMKRVNGEKD